MGVGIFTGSNYWLKVGVRANNPVNTFTYTVLAPLQAVLPTPLCYHGELRQQPAGDVAVTGSI